jgi:hypothetical protein
MRQEPVRDFPIKVRGKQEQAFDFAWHEHRQDSNTALRFSSKASGLCGLDNSF